MSTRSDGPTYESWLWSGRVECRAQWVDVSTYLVDRLAECLGIELGSSLVTVVADGFACRVRGGFATGGMLQLEWYGGLGMERIRGRSHVSASLFLFSQGRRLSIAGQQRSRLGLVFVPGRDGGWWSSEGWQDDVRGEYDDADP